MKQAIRPCELGLNSGRDPILQASWPAGPSAATQGIGRLHGEPPLSPAHGERWRIKHSRESRGIAVVGKRQLYVNSS